MPAETHQHAEPITASDVLDLLAAALGEDAVDPRATLNDLGIVDELSVLAVWEMTVEEYGERSIGEPDLDDLLECTTAAGLASTIAVAITSTRRT